MPFLRIHRDKRGYEYFALVHTSSGRRGKVRQRVLYWYRSPPNVRVGRPPIDEDVMRALEAQYPNVKFDWEALRNTQVPPPTIDWRERRLAQRAARQFRDADENSVAPDVEESPVLAAPEPGETAPPFADEPVLEALAPIIDLIPVFPKDSLNAAVSASFDRQTPGGGPDPAPASRGRRRRRRGRRGRPLAGPAAGPPFARPGAGSPGAAAPPGPSAQAGAEPAQTAGAVSSSVGSDPDEAPADDEPGDAGGQES